MISIFDPGVLWHDFGIHLDVVVWIQVFIIYALRLIHVTPQAFTHSFPCADIHLLLAPDLLHQLIKGTFKDHLVTWVSDYLHAVHGEKKALEVITDIDHWYVCMPGNITYNSQCEPLESLLSPLIPVYVNSPMAETSTSGQAMTQRH